MRNSILVVLAILAIQGHVFSTGIAYQDAQIIALNFYKIQVPTLTTSPLIATLQYTETESNGQVDFYVFDIAPSPGFVIVSADDNSTPVIAYSTESNFNANADMTGVGYWMKTAAKKISYARVQNTLPDAKIKHLWNSYRLGVNPVLTKSAAVTIGPLLTTTWNQEPNYNSLCPYNTTDHQRCVTGCVATAMAQIMKYWNYPSRGTGSYSYSLNTYGTLSANFTNKFNWSAMPNNVTTTSDPVDTLMYLCGVSVAMNYGDDISGGSGAFVLQSDIGQGNPCSEYSYANYFKYNPNTLQGVYMSSYSTADWISLMENELNAGRVIQYEGYDQSSGGHTWVCDGYDARDFLHMNWGWGGASNGYYSVNNLNAAGYTFSQNDAALIGIEPLYPVSLSVSPVTPVICSGSNTTLMAQGPTAAAYTWTPSIGLSCTTCTSPIASPSATTLYTVTVDSSGVTSTRSVAVIVKPSVVSNFSFNPAPSCSLPERVVFSNSSTNGTTYQWDFGDGTTSTDANPVHTYRANGDYTALLITSNSCGADTSIVHQAVHILAGAPIASCQNICAGEAITINATGGGSLAWYDAASQGNLMAAGNQYATPPLTSTVTYYVASLVTPPIVSVGPATNTFGAGSYNSYSSNAAMIFNSSVDQYLVSVEVFASYAGSRTFLIEDQNGNILDSTTVNLINGTQTVPLTLSVPAANNLRLTTIGDPGLYNNSSGAVYPYTAGDGSLQITGNNTGSPGAYYYFYNWKMEQLACSSAITPVTVFVLGTNGGGFKATGSGSPTVYFAPADTNAATYSWDFGDGSSSSQINPVHTYAAAGSYTVQLIVSNDTCSDTISKKISTVQLGLNDINSQIDLSIFPNPAKDELSLHISHMTALGSYEVKISNILGQTEYINSIHTTQADTDLKLDISILSDGIYFISLQQGKEIVSSKFVKVSQ